MNQYGVGSGPEVPGPTPSNVDGLDLGRGLPAWLLRVVIAGAAGGIVAVLAAQGIAGAALILLGAAALISVAVPASPGPTLVIVLVALSVLIVNPDPFSPRVLALVPLVHLLHVSCAIAGALPRVARVHLSALRAPFVRWIAIQAGVFALAGIIALTPSQWRSAPLELAAIVGMVAIGVTLGMGQRAPR